MVCGIIMYHSVFSSLVDAGIYKPPPPLCRRPQQGVVQVDSDRAFSLWGGCACAEIYRTLRFGDSEVPGHR